MEIFSPSVEAGELLSEVMVYVTGEPKGLRSMFVYVTLFGPQLTSAPDAGM